MRVIGWVLVALTVLGVSAPASGEDIWLGVQSGGELVRTHEVVSAQPFTIVTHMSTGGRDSNAAEWVQTEVQQHVPTTFKLSTQMRNPTGWPIGDTSRGEYITAFGSCVEASEEFWLVSVQYGYFAQEPFPELVLTLRGIQPGDTRPSSFNGEPGFVDCSENKIPLTVQRGDTWQTGSGAIVPSGGIVLNPTPPVAVGTEPGTWSQLKGAYR